MNRLLIGLATLATCFALGTPNALAWGICARGPWVLDPQNGSWGGESVCNCNWAIYGTYNQRKNSTPALGYKGAASVIGASNGGIGAEWLWVDGNGIYHYVPVVDASEMLFTVGYPGGPVTKDRLHNNAVQMTVQYYYRSVCITNLPSLNPGPYAQAYNPTDSMTDFWYNQ